MVDILLRLSLNLNKTLNPFWSIISIYQSPHFPVITYIKISIQQKSSPTKLYALAQVKGHHQDGICLVKLNR